MGYLSNILERKERKKEASGYFGDSWVVCGVGWAAWPGFAYEK
jgi:hypothetical protein